jgi:hypothetical protein
MNTSETLKAIADLISDHERGAVLLNIESDPLAVNIRTLLNRHVASIEEKKASRAEWATEVRSAADVANTIDGGAFGRRLEIVLDTAASLVEHGSDLGGMLSYRIRSLAQVTTVYAHADALRVRAALDAADALGGAGNALFNAAGATPAVRRVWKAEEALRAAFGFADPDAAPASGPEKKE